MTEAVHHAKQVFYLLVEFDSDFGQFPSDATAVVHRDKNGEVSWDLSAFKGDYSNDYMGQFIAAGYTASEEIFYARIPDVKKPDNVISPRGKILEAGECGFVYVKNQSTSNNAGRPLLITPMSGQGLQFDPDVFGGKTVVLRIDGAVKQLIINEEGDVCIGQGQTLFQSGTDTVWGEGEFNPSMIVFPELRK